ncbi:hypothetical protein [Nostoc sp.]|uniref:hypothetical protein n=1 Tax=Nostoc sp. TaxID=1180 RepID=UPI002FF5291D
MPNAQCPMPNAQCPIPNAPCPMPNAQCPIPNYVGLTQLAQRDRNLIVQEYYKERISVIGSCSN